MKFSVTHRHSLGMGAIGILAGAAFAGGGPIFDDDSTIVNELITGWNAQFADLNGDGIKDFIYPNGHVFKVAMGVGDGTTENSTDYVFAFGFDSDINEVLPVDLDQDGDTDLVAFVVVYEFDGFEATQYTQFQAYENDGSGSFTLLGPLIYGGHSDDATNEYTYMARVMDFDGDGMRNDIAITNRTTARVYTWDGSWSAGPWTVNNFGPIRDIEMSDYNLDGYEDIILLHGNYDDSRITVFGNDSGSSFTETQSFVPGERPSNIGIGNFDGDAFPDLAVYLQSTNASDEDSIRVYSNSGTTVPFDNELYTFGVNYNEIEQDITPHRMVVGDLDLDGDDDLVFSQLNHLHDKHVYLNDEFEAFVYKETFFTIGNLLSLVDLNNDGFIDFVSSRPSGTPSVLLNQLIDACPSDLTGDGNLNFLDVSLFLKDQVDFNEDMAFNFLDVSAFLAAFAAGCP